MLAKEPKFNEPVDWNESVNENERRRRKESLPNSIHTSEATLLVSVIKMNSKRFFNKKKLKRNAKIFQQEPFLQLKMSFFDEIYAKY